MKTRSAAALAAEVLPVSVAELGVALTLFRRAAFDEAAEDRFQPLSDQFAVASLSEVGFRRGMMILTIHYDFPDAATPIMRRIESFVKLLRAVTTKQDETWIRFAADFDRYVPILYAISWCAARPCQPFPISDFIRIASHAPLVISLESSSYLPN